MDKIKFRAWDKKVKRMRAVNSIGFHYEDECYDFDKSRLPKVVNVWGYDVIENKSIILHREIEEVELMRYTGLSDKNNTDVYEGDIVQSVLEDYGIKENVYVEMCEDGYWAVYENKYKLICMLRAFSHGNYEVIGNIYENQELLAEGK